ncbi:transposase [Acidisoma cellulosilytica]|uniref:Transposase n=1 Tax=Acidisoma cellulosilyticum TaxID=2802395 RepID=A0A964E725_9PROT|nr:transposase [Acidisoma cellulosilyticum]
MAEDLAKWLDRNGMDHIRGVPCHPQTQGKIERWHQTLKRRLLLEHHYLHSKLASQIETFIDHCNHHRYHESLDNLTPVDVYTGCGTTMLRERQRIRRRTIQNRRFIHTKAPPKHVP